MTNKRAKFSNHLIGSIYLRDNGECQMCGKSQDIHIHHVDLDRNNNLLDNLQLLCKECHKLIHSKNGRKRYYDEEEISHHIPSIPFSEYKLTTGWNLYVDSTDHFGFACPKCNVPSTIYQVFTIDNNKKPFNKICPVFFFKLKCNNCKLKGQRKCYLNPFLLTEWNNQWKKTYGKTNL